MIPRLLTGILFVYHFVRLAMSPEAYGRYDARGGRAKPVGRCSQCGFNYCADAKVLAQADQLRRRVVRS